PFPSPEMCGVAGIFRRGGEPIDPGVLRRMSDTLVHRGPDGEGFHVEPGRPSIGLASRRLAVIDIPGGAQPMSTEDSRFTIVYNGEVFNAAELRAQLEGHGHRFRSRCVRRLPAGHHVVVDEAGTRETRYWDCAFEEEPDAGRAAYREEVRGLLEDAVRRRLVADVPLGSFISGGIDSGMVTTVAARAAGEPL